MAFQEDNISAEEKIKRIIELEEEKQSELEEKKKELEEKQEELKALEKERSRQAAVARKRIEEKIQELALEEKQQFEELEDAKKKRLLQESSLERSVEEATVKSSFAEQGQKGYGAPIEEILKGNAGFYEVTNYNVMNQLERISREASNRPLTSSENQFVSLIQYHAEKMSGNDFYRQKDTNDYISRELEKINHINREIRKREEKSGGDYIT